MPFIIIYKYAFIPFSTRLLKRVLNDDLMTLYIKGIFDTTLYMLPFNQTTFGDTLIIIVFLLILNFCDISIIQNISDSIINYYYVKKMN